MVQPRLEFFASCFFIPRQFEHEDTARNGQEFRVVRVGALAETAPQILATGQLLLGVEALEFKRVIR